MQESPAPGPLLFIAANSRLVGAVIVARAIRRYEQEPGEAETSARLGLYVPSIQTKNLSSMRYKAHFKSSVHVRTRAVKV